MSLSEAVNLVICLNKLATEAQPLKKIQTQDNSHPSWLPTATDWIFCR